MNGIDENFIKFDKFQVVSLVIEKLLASFRICTEVSVNSCYISGTSRNTPLWRKFYTDHTL